MKSSLSWLVCAAVLLGSPAASAGTSPIESNVGIRVIGGRPSPSSSYSLGLCVGDNPATCEYRCGAVLLAKNVLVTARHCLGLNAGPYACVAGETLGDSPLPPSSFWVTTSPRVSDVTAPTWHQVKEWTLIPTRKVCGGDLVFGVLATAVLPEEATPAVPVIAANAQGLTQAFSLVAFGGTDAAGAGSGTRRQVDGIPFLCGYGLPCPRDLVFSKHEFALPQGACVGDSGGGAFGPPTEVPARLYGVLSRSVAGDTECGRGVFERLDTWTDTISQVVTRGATIGNYPVPAWVAALPPPAREIPPFPARALGAECSSASTCDSAVCGAADGETWRCTEPCGQDGACASGFACTGGFCYAAKPSSDRGGGCAVAARAPVAVPKWPAPLTVLVAIAALARLTARKRSR